MNNKIQLSRDRTEFILELLEFLKKMQLPPSYNFLLYYQKIILWYISRADTNSRGMLISLAMGLGKSLVGVSIAFELMNTHDVIFLMSKSLKNNMLKEIYKYIQFRGDVDPSFICKNMTKTELDNWVASKFKFVSMNASNMIDQLQKAAESDTLREIKQLQIHTKKGTSSKGSRGVQNNEELSNLDNLNGKVVIVDEAHNLFRAVINGSKNAVRFYETVMNSSNLKLFFLTGTPCSNDPFELVPCFNMLGSSRPNTPIFPESYTEFAKAFISNTGDINPLTRAKFQNRIFGLVSHVSSSSTPGAAIGLTKNSSTAEFPEELPTKFVFVNMYRSQFNTYLLARDLEQEELERSLKRGTKASSGMQKPRGASSSYRVKSRQISNFCPPNVNFDTKKSGNVAKTPWDLPDDAITAPKLDALLDVIKKHDGTGIVYSQFINMGGLGVIQRFLELHGWKLFNNVAKVTVEIEAEDGVEDKASLSKEPAVEPAVKSESKKTHDDVAKKFAEKVAGYYFNEYRGGNATHTDANNSKHHKTTMAAAVAATSLLASAATGMFIGADTTDTKDANNIKTIIEQDAHLKKQDKKTQLQASASKASASKASASKTTAKCFAVIRGDIDVDIRTEIQNIFNSPENQDGSIISLLLVSSTGAEGLDLKNVRYVVIYEPYWTNARHRQVIARAVRTNSHIGLPLASRNVQPYIFISVPPESEHKAYQRNDPNITSLVDGLVRLDKHNKLFNVDSTDTDIYLKSLVNYNSLQSFVAAVNETAIECMLNAEKTCRVCVPNQTKLFTDDFAKDMLRNDPCIPYTERKMSAKTLMYEGVQYKYADNPDSIYKIRFFQFSKKIDAWVAVKEADPLFDALLAILRPQ